VSGSLPADGETSVAGVRLPAGKRTGPDGESGRPPQPTLWVTGEFGDAAGAWLALRERLGGTGLVPLLLSGLRGERKAQACDGRGKQQPRGARGAN